MLRYNDPFKQVIAIVRKRYPRLKAKIYFCDNKNMVPRTKGSRHGSAGYTDFRNYRGAIPHVVINAGIPVFAATETLAHELAHVITGPKAGHGPEWRRAFSWIHKEWLKLERRKT